MSVYRRASGIYHYDFKFNRVRFYGSTSLTSKREAELFEQAKREEAKERAAFVKEQRSAPMTVNVAFDKFWLTTGQHYKGSYQPTFFGALAWLAKELGANTLLRDLTQNRIADAVARRRGDGVSNATVNRTVTEPLRRIMKRAGDTWEQELRKIDWGKLLLDEPKERIRELRDHEEIALLPAMREDYRPILAFFLASGCRLKEAVNLRWQDIDWTARTITILGKGDKPAPIPLTDDMRAILGPLRDHHPEFVFTYVSRHPGRDRARVGMRRPITYEGMKTAWRRYGGAAAGLQDFRLHDTRHTIATRLLRETGNLKLVQQLLRHEDITTTAKYAHTDLSDLHAALNRVEKSRRASRNQQSDDDEKTG
jgi:integrase